MLCTWSHSLSGGTNSVTVSLSFIEIFAKIDNAKPLHFQFPFYVESTSSKLAWVRALSSSVQFSSAIANLHRPTKQFDGRIESRHSRWKVGEVNFR